MSSLSPINVAQDQSNFISPKNNFLCDSHSQSKTDRTNIDENKNQISKLNNGNNDNINKSIALTGNFSNNLKNDNNS